MKKMNLQLGRGVLEWGARVVFIHLWGVRDGLEAVKKRFRGSLWQPTHLVFIQQAFTEIFTCVRNSPNYCVSSVLDKRRVQGTDTALPYGAYFSGKDDRRSIHGLQIKYVIAQWFTPHVKRDSEHLEGNIHLEELYVSPKDTKRSLYCF